MSEVHESLTRKKLKSPRAAAFDGTLFTELYGTGMVLIRSSIPANQVADSVWLDTNSRTVALALNLVPYSGIAFLWFIGVIRDRLGEMEDRLFSTVFQGSGLLFLALIFTGAALAGGLLSIGHFLWVSLVFLGWVLVVSVYILILNLRGQSQEELVKI